MTFKNDPAKTKEYGARRTQHRFDIPHGMIYATTDNDETYKIDVFIADDDGFTADEVDQIVDLLKGFER